MSKEVIEYKSNGHPDTLTDNVVEECATYLDKYYKEKLKNRKDIVEVWLVHFSGWRYYICKILKREKKC